MNFQDKTLLDQYVKLDLSEIGNYGSKLLELSRFSADHGMSESFQKEVAEEMSRMLNEYRINCRIVTKSVPQLPQIVTELERTTPLSL